MSRALLRVSLLAGALIWVAGCGGSSGAGSGGGNNSTTVTFTITGGTPAAVATKIGSGSFAAATLTAGKLTLSLPSGTTNFAVAFACPAVSLRPTSQAQEAIENVFQASTLDGTSFSQSCPTAPGTGTTGTLTGSVDASAIPVASFLDINAGNGTGQSSTTLGSSSGSFSLAAPAGTDRVEVAAYSSVQVSVSNGFFETISLVAAKSFSSQTVPGALNGGNTVVFSAADETTLEPLTYSSVPSGYGAPSTLVGYEMGGQGAFLIASFATSGYPVLPAGATQSGDSYVFTASAQNTSNAIERVVVTTTSASAVPESFAFPTAWSYAGPTPAALPSFDLSYTGFSGKTDVHNGVGMTWVTGSTTENLVAVTATENYLNGSTTLAVPDLSNLTGFIAPPASGTDVVWTAEISQGSSSSGQSSGSNGTVTTVLNTGHYKVP
jgi:hypothetical protein